ncbi:nucleotidyltransferase domain-containing protein [Vibrio vulnificus]|nr:nucleotidyltransferase domain-containing protein [Vibrio vulnificus]EGQ9329705.1 nucleotidyltransferase domain-containing protein [Vibrio vulnificus]EGQ9781316.1 nucleotidyltransferase domain-containing protein [Vibrio vulnificus]EGR0087242.1 nucleotidyltransferase domain-containing protein [Vibrio vulnificus]EGR7964346.1 nucleotidyltransferase domain-containing protein [Vibrio vulnificus]
MWKQGSTTTLPVITTLEPTLRTSGITEQSAFLSKHVPDLTTEQATLILEQGLKRDSTVVFGGSRIRGDFSKGSDIDVGFGSLSEKQAQRIIKNINKTTADNPHFLKMEELTIVPGKSTQTIETMTTPEQFFQRAGIRAGGDLKAGQPYTPSGSITIAPDGKIIILPPGG